MGRERCTELFPSLAGAGIYQAQEKKSCTSAMICTVLVDNGLCWGGVMRFPVFEHTLKRMFEKRKKMVPSCQVLRH